MEFLSLPFFGCMLLTFVLFYARQDVRWRRWLLLVASCVFIGYYHLAYLVIAVAITLFTFYSGRLIHRHLGTRLGSWLFVGSIAGLVGFWLIARYWFPLFPLGISFYTFQALSYLIEIYWEEEPDDDLLGFTLYMLLFMKFLSGPIERAYDLLPQLKTVHRFDERQVVGGMLTVAWGAFLKLVIADRIAPSLDSVLDNVRAASGMQLLEATLLYPIQLYADFAGYTHMALGFGRMLGFRLSPNFERPFISQSTAELWRRWHQSLSFWVRDYVYMPLSAELRSWGRSGIYVAVVVTFVVIGVWHGAGWTFALYGLFQGLVILYETVFQRQREFVHKHILRRGWQPLMIVRTYLLFALSLLFFRVASVGDVFYTYRHLFDGMQTNVKELGLMMTDGEWIVFGIAVVLMFIAETANARHNLIRRLMATPVALRWACYFAFLAIIFFYGAFGVENFIYIQF